MAKDDTCEHDFLSVLHCKKCGEQYHVEWLNAIKQAKLDAVAEVLQRTKSTITIRAEKNHEKQALKIVEKALKEVGQVYEQSVENTKAEDMIVNFKTETPSK